MDKKNVVILVLAVLLTAVVAGGGVYLWQQNGNSSTTETNNSQAETPKETEQVGTLPEESESQPQPAAQKTEKELITEAMATKYSKPVSDVSLEINESDGTHASGVVKFAGDIAGAWWLAVKENGSWKIVADGNGVVMCDDIDPYNFPTSMVPECWDEATQTNITR